MERWIEKFDGCYPDGYPRSRYIHDSCVVEGRSFSSYYPYCPYCGKAITHIKVLRDGFENYKIKKAKELGYVCEL